FLGYFTFFGVFGGQTPGKMYFRFQVVMKNGAGVPVLKALIRTLGYFLGFLSLGLGFLAAAVTPSGRALHDFLAGTRVEKRPSS
ncbi:MAG TPA: RDD family protein, partial [Nitrospiria bacterium]|nr:RDD family protein [Nitrospiria bacterium]